MFSKSIVKYIQSLQHKKFRDQYNVFVAEGPKVVAELLQSDAFTCSGLYALKEWTDDHAVLLHRFAGIITVIKDFELEKISGLKTPNKVLGVFEKKPVQPVDAKGKLTLALDDIQDPGNMGTIIRTADWFGIEHIICSPNTADMYNSKVVQSTMASLARVNILYTGLEEWLLNCAVKKYAAALEGKPLSDCKGLKEGIIIIGNESKGIQSSLLELAEKITIPKNGEAESLNAAVATGIILFAARST